jgi:hypothetical protein
VFSGLHLQAQVVYYEDPGVSRLLQTFKDGNTSPEKVINGWRIQLASTVDRRQVEQSKKTFQQEFPGYPVVVVFNNPYYKLRVGAFLTKTEAQSSLNRIKQRYNTAYLAQDKIKAAEFKNQ